MKTLLICHHDAPLDLDGLARWMGSFSELVGIIVVKEGPDELKRRIRFELKRVGRARFLDVLAFRAYYKLRHAGSDDAFEAALITGLSQRYPAVSAPVLATQSPNSQEAEAFIRQAAPDVVIARSKMLIKERVFCIAKHGTFVMHPGICPEYRNSHGCFWALANDDLEKVGVTLLKIDKGVDTGPVYGYYTYDFDELAESHHRIQMRCVSENLDAIAAKLQDIVAGRAQPLKTEGRASASWGQPWLSKHLAWKRKARHRAGGVAPGPGLPTRARAILYHDVVDGDFESSGFKGGAANRYKLTRAEFADHLKAIADRVARTSGTAQAVSGSNADGLFPAGAPFLFTVDDGGASALHIADQIEQHGWRGYFLITTDYIGAPGFVGPQDLRELHARGHFVGSHSCSHPYRMAELPEAQLDAEWASSAAKLQDILGAPVTSASVPGGFYAPRVARSAAKAGIRVLFTSEPRTAVEAVGACAVVGRYNIYRGTSPAEAAALACGDWLPSVRQQVLWETKKAAKSILKPVWDQSRRIVFKN